MNSQASGSLNFATIYGIDAVGIGDGVTVIGNNASVKAAQGVAIGQHTTAENQATAIGSDVFALGASSIAIGNDDISSEYTDRLPLTTIEKIYRDKNSDNSFAGTALGGKYFWNTQANQFLEKYANKSETDVSDTDNRKYSPTAARGIGAISIGSRAVAYGKGSTTLGTLSFALADRSTAIGLRSFADFIATGATAIGEESRVFAANTIAMGNKSEATSIGSLALGNNSRAVGLGSVSIGDTVGSNAKLTTDNFNIFTDRLKIFGQMGDFDGNNFDTSKITSGNSNKLVQAGFIANQNTKIIKKRIDALINGLQDDSTRADIINNLGIPNETSVLSKYDDAYNFLYEKEGETIITTTEDIKKTSKKGDHAISLGHYVLNSGDNSIGIGTASAILGNNSVALGALNYVATDADNTVVIGIGANVEKENTVVIGTGSRSLGAGAIALGAGVVTTKDSSIGIGYGVENQSQSTVALGTGSKIELGSDRSMTFGSDSIVKTNTTDAIALGTKAEATLKNSVALGYLSKTDYKESDLNMPGYTLKGAYSIPSSANVGVISVGYKGYERRIVNVASGYLDSDAVNVAQLRTIEDRLNLIVNNESEPIRYYSINSTSGLGKKYKELAEKEYNYKKYINLKTQQLIILAREKNGEIINQSTKTDINNEINAIAENTRNIATNLNALETNITNNTYGQGSSMNYSQFINDLENAKTNDSNATVITSAEKEEMNNNNFFNNQALASESLAAGLGAKATVDSGIALGSKSLANREGNSVSGYDHSTNTASTETNSTWKATHGALSIGNGSSITRQITGVAAGSEDTDAVNVAQLKKVVASASGNTVLNLSKDGNDNAGSVNLSSQKLQIIGDSGLEVDIANQKVTVKLNKATSDSISEIATLKDVKMTYGADNSSILERKNSEAKTLKIISDDFAKSVSSNPAINYSGDNIETDLEINNSGANIKIGIKREPIFDKITIKNANNQEGPILSTSGIDMKNQKISNLLDGDISNNSKEAITGSQLYTLKENKIIFSDGTTLANVENSFDRKNGEDAKIIFKASDLIDTSYKGENLKVELDKNNKTFKVALKESPNFTTVTANTSFVVTGGPSISTSGIAMANKKISGLQEAIIDENSTEAVSGKQLHAIKQNIVDKIKYSDANNEKEVALTTGLKFIGSGVTIEAKDGGEINFTVANQNIDTSNFATKDDVSKKENAFAKGELKGTTDVIKITNGVGKLVGSDATIDLDDKIKDEIAKISNKVDSSELNKYAKKDGSSIDDTNKETWRNNLDIYSKTETDNKISGIKIKYRANDDTNSEEVALTTGLNFKSSGTNLSASVAANGVITYTLNETTSINKDAGKPIANGNTNHPDKLVTEKAVVDYVANEISNISKDTTTLSNNSITFKDKAGSQIVRKNSEDLVLTIKEDDINDFKSKNLKVVLDTTNKVYKIGFSDTPEFKTISIENSGPILSATGLDIKNQKISNLANGKVDLDAVNVSQLKPLITAIGGKIDANTGNITGPSYELKAGAETATAYNTVDSALKALDGAITNVKENTSKQKITYKANNGSETKTTTLESGFDFTNGINTTAEVSDGGVVKFNLNDNLTSIKSISGATDNKSKVTFEDSGLKLTHDGKELVISKDVNGIKLSGLENRKASNSENYGVGDNETRAATEAALKEIAEKIGVPSNNQNPSTGPAGKDGLDGKSIIEKVEKLRDGLSGNTVYTKVDGTRVVKDGDKYYEIGANDVADKTKEVPKDKIILSVVNPDGGSTTKPLVLANISSGLGIDTETGKVINNVDAKTKIDTLLKETKKEELNKAVTVADLQAIANSGIYFKGNSGDLIHKALGNTLTIKGEGNISIENKTEELVVKLSENMTGIKTIVGLEDLNDNSSGDSAVNKNYVDKKMDKVTKGIESALSGVSNAVAMANLPSINSSSNHKHSIAASYGNYGTEHAFALGLSGINNTGDLVYKASGSLNTRGKIALGAGLAYQFDEREMVSNEFENQLKAEIEKLKKENAMKDEKLETETKKLEDRIKYLEDIIKQILNK